MRFAIGLWRCRLKQRPKTPELPGLRQIEDRRAGGSAAGVTGKRDAQLDPSDEVLNLARAELVRIVRWHLQVVVDPADRPNQHAGIRFAGLHDPPGLTTLNQEVAPVEPQLALAFFTGVTREAALDENRPDLVLEEGLAGACHIVIRTGGQRCPTDGDAEHDCLEKAASHEAVPRR